VGVILAAGLDPAQFPADVRAGVGAAGAPDRSWREARTALRFTSDREPVVHFDGLGALALLALVPPDLARANRDVAAIAGLTDDDRTTLDTFCATGSLRRAAERLHLHHSSVSRRLEQIGRALGFDLTDPTGTTRARLASTAWRLLGD
jgi:sugar diacid utilization regulator